MLTYADGQKPTQIKLIVSLSCFNLKSIDCSATASHYAFSFLYSLCTRHHHHHHHYRRHDEPYAMLIIICGFCCLPCVNPFLFIFRTHARLLARVCV